jgi:polyisoprenoid-binding protein YceI
MTIALGTYALGPDNATLHVQTGKGGAASKAGHNLLIEVTAWSGTLRVGSSSADTSASLRVDSGSFKVLQGTGGIQALGDEDRVSIEKTIVDEVLKGGTIAFDSTLVDAPSANGSLLIRGELDLLGTRRPIAFALDTQADGGFHADATVSQTEWGMRPYSALFGTLRVLDDVVVSLEGRLTSG